MKVLRPTVQDDHPNSILEMSRAGTFLNIYKVCVYEGEGRIPHFHIWTGDPKRPSFESCVRIHSAGYFNHKDHHRTLNAKQKNALIVWLKAPSKEDPERTDWQEIRKLWNQNNPRYRELSVEEPDYENL